MRSEGQRDGNLYDEPVADVIPERAGAQDVTTETWARKELEAVANRPVVRRAYTLVAVSPLGIALQLGRYPDGRAKVICGYALTVDAHARVDGWLALLRRNAPGDREAAIWDMAKCSIKSSSSKRPSPVQWIK